jgi:hypothetical protein
MGRRTLAWPMMMLTIAVVSIAGARAQDPAPAGGDHDAHADHMLFRTATAPAVTPIADPRLRASQIQFTPTDLRGNVLPPGAAPARDATLVVIEGDIVMGTLGEVQGGVLADVLRQARALAPDDSALDSLSPEQRRAWDALQRAGRAAAAAPEGRAAIDARAAAVGRLLQQATALGLGNEASPGALGQVAAATAPLREAVAKAGDVGAAPGAGIDPESVQFAVPVAAGVGGYLWPGGVIGWQFHQSFPQAQRQSVLDAIAHWHARTSHVRFVRLTRSNLGRFRNWIVFVPGDGCAARVGMRPSPGGQAVLLASGCGTPQAIHELGHIVGLWHEQSRNDRDRFLRVNYGNIAASTRYNFDLVGQNGLDFGPILDFNSIMLYPAAAFSTGAGPSLQRLDGGNANFGIFTPGLGGSTTGLSPTDVAGVAFLYPDEARVADLEPPGAAVALHADGAPPRP